jgi:hypothetical protein
MAAVNGGEFDLAGPTLLFWIAIFVVTGLSQRLLLSKASASSDRHRLYHDPNLTIFGRKYHLWRLVRFDARVALITLALWFWVVGLPLLALYRN